MKTFKTYLYEKENEDSHPTIYTHYSHASDLNHLSGNMSGTGIKGAEQERLKGTTDSRIKSRVYFYPTAMSGDLPRPESGLGKHVYQTNLSNLHDATKQSSIGDKIAETARKHISNGDSESNSFERAVLDHGFDGYRTKRMAVVMGKDVPVKYVGTHHGKTFGDTPPETSKEESKSLVDSPLNSQGEHSSSILTNLQASFFHQNRQILTKDAPSLKQKYGRLYVHGSDNQKLKNSLSAFPGHPL